MFAGLFPKLIVKKYTSNQGPNSPSKEVKEVDCKGSCIKTQSYNMSGDPNAPFKTDRYCVDEFREDGCLKFRVSTAVGSRNSHVEKCDF